MPRVGNQPTSESIRSAAARDETVSAAPTGPLVGFALTALRRPASMPRCSLVTGEEAGGAERPDRENGGRRSGHEDEPDHLARE
ncbi:hypothetical protein [Nocardioides guangzhouensis]|uniref:hypothetical protein n=1 Tax=Nocardioides guangzhouensis TaxID=2497878 RepID=UPI0014385125|nr:hypothetical protein [Nocardioides guangzhouensis]